MKKIPSDTGSKPGANTLGEQWDLLTRHDQKIVMTVDMGRRNFRDFIVKRITGNTFSVQYNEVSKQFQAKSMTDLQGCCHMVYEEYIQWMHYL